MSNSIFRATIPVEDYQLVSMTGDPIAVAADRRGFDDAIDIWWEHVDETNLGAHETSVHFDRAIYIFGTGHSTPWTTYTRYAWRHIGTVVTPGGFLIWHVYVGPRRGVQIAV
jgi:hypothetical protein